MEMSGTDKEIRRQTSPLPYNNHNLIRETSSETMDHGSDPDRFDGSGASVTPISVGSRLLKSPPRPARYRECLKNHAANMGGNVTDGCGEFMPSGDDGTLEALKCAACNCHRNFHRKETATTTTTTAVVAAGPFLQLPPPLPSPTTFNNRTAVTPTMSLHHHPHPNWSSPPLKIFSTVGGRGGGTESSSEELNFTTASVPAYGVIKKRFRTKFTQDQKEKMLEFAEKVGWRIPREDDSEVQRFCAENGVKRQVLKVWIHNNKSSSSGKKMQVQDSNETID